MSTRQLLATTDAFQCLALITLANISECTDPIGFLYGVLTESTLVRLFVCFRLLARFAQMVRIGLTIIAENLLTLGAINPV